MPNDGSDFSYGDLFTFRHANNIKNNWASATAPSSPVEGLPWWDTGNGKYKIYDGASWITVIFDNDAPIGSIVAWIGGYFTDGSNGGYTRVLGTANTVAAVNTLYNSSGFYACDGSALNDADSPIYDGANRYLPNLTDDRFLMGDTTAGGSGGSSTQAHTHNVDITSFDTGNPSDTTIATGSTHGVPTDTHNHAVDPPNTASGAATATENRPLYLSCFYLQKVKEP